MMFIPDLSLSKRRIQIGNRGAVLVFEVGSLEFMRPDDPYRSVVEELEKEGIGRNVFMVDNNGLPIWRVESQGEYKLGNAVDAFIGIWGRDKAICSKREYQDFVDESCGYVYGQTFYGFIYKIRLSDGALSDRTWTKE